MNTLYFHILRILANRRANQRITALLKEHSTSNVKFRYSQECLSFRLYTPASGRHDFHALELKIDAVSAAIQAVLHQRQNTIAALHQERYSHRDSL